MHVKRTSLLFPVIGVVLAMVAISCTSNNSSSSSSGSTTPQVMTVATTANVTTWDPAASFSTEAFYMTNLYEGLLSVNPPGSADPYTPVLATSWEHSEDGLTWTWHLRDGVTFHDGEAFDADAAKKSIDGRPTTPARRSSGRRSKSVKVKDASTIEMTLKYAAPMELIAGSTYAAWMVAPDAIDAATSDKKYFEKGIDAGTGPYAIDSYTADEEVDLKAYDGYWGGWDGAHASDVVVKIVPEAAQQQQLLDGGEVDIATRVPPESLATYASNPAFAVTRDASWFNYTAFFNTQRPPLDDPKVRQALSYAIPYQDIIDVATLGYATQSYGAVPKGVFPFSDQVPQYTTDLDEGRVDALGRGPSGWWVHPATHVRLREPGRGEDGAADPGLLQADRRHRRDQGDPVQPAVGGRQGRPGQRPGHLPAPVLADLRGRGHGQPVLDVPLCETRPSST